MKSTISPKSKAVRVGSIVFHPPRMERRFLLFTLTGEPVYQFGYTGYTLEKKSHSQQSTSYGDVGDDMRQKRVAKATAKLGVPVEWLEGKTVEIMGVSF